MSSKLALPRHIHIDRSVMPLKLWRCYQSIKMAANAYLMSRKRNLKVLIYYFIEKI